MPPEVRIHNPSFSNGFYAIVCRFFCGNVRSFDMTISDQTTNEVIRLYRPLTCQGCCCSALYPHCTQVNTPHNQRERSCTNQFSIFRR